MSMLGLSGKRIVDLERRSRRTERLGFALLLIITVAVTVALGFTIFTAVKASQASIRNRAIIGQVGEEAHKTRLVGEDVLARLGTLERLLNELVAERGLPTITSPPRVSRPETTAAPRRTSAPSTPRPTGRTPPPATQPPPTPPPSSTPAPTPCPLPICLPVGGS